MNKLSSHDLILLQHQLMMSMGVTSDPEKMLRDFSRLLIESLDLTAVHIDQKRNLKTDTQTRSRTYYPDKHYEMGATYITHYIGVESPRESKYLELRKVSNKYWYCFSLNNIGFMVLERPETFLNEKVIPALTPVIIRMSKTYSGRKQHIVNKQQRAEIHNISTNLRTEKLKLEQILRSIEDSVMVLDKSGLITFSNHAAHKLFGADKATMVNTHFTKYLRVYDLDGNKDMTRTIGKSVINKGEWSTPRPVKLITQDNQELYVRLRVKGMFDEKYSDPSDEKYYVSTFHDVTDSYRLEQKLQIQVKHDALTGCLNRHGFGERLAQYITSRENDDNLSFVSIDLDRFKLINDIGGHQAGDALLKSVTQLIEHDINGRGSLARLGGDEFVILFNKIEPQLVEHITEDICKSIDRLRFKWEQNIFTIGASFGISHSCGKEIDTDDAFMRADEACLMSKENGRNQVTIAPKSIGNECDAQNKIIHHFNRNYLHYINQALKGTDKEYQLVLFKQDIRSISPIFQGNHHEVLLRLFHKNTIIPPDTFLPAAERSGIVREIDLFVLEKTLRYLTKNIGGHYNVNLSGVSLSDDVTRQKIQQLIAKFPNESKFLCLEITETAAITNLAKCIRFMEELNEVGVSFALDDFGTGVSSFSYLKSLPVKYLKIDGSFIHDICNNEIDEIVVQSIVSASRAMKIRTVAEYVSDEDILTKVTSLGIDYAQGYWMNIPSRLN
ncbi:sensor domain-containing protein [Leucothrix arctica]|uniref:GGDEF domain-containing protein n=1 Tax=Leucothrix arctica TaxID=1481894 RepID=A0A317CLR9_9GAMM|nr:EAL domain-containing protein [Leucothrix arctica]PWQ98393.1 hypothetical protein DKT75_04500 [Leucothrix arctica]